MATVPERETSRIPTSKPPRGRRAADAIRRSKERIVAIWTERTRNEINAAKELPSSILIDSLPDFLEDLGESLDRGRIEHDKIAAEDSKSQVHGAIRVDFSWYSLAQLQDEYRILRQVIFHVLEEEGPLEGIEREIIFDTVLLAVRSASARFSELLLKRETESLRREAEALRLGEESAALLNSLVESAPIGMAFLDRENRFRRINENFARLNGRSAQDHLGKTVREVLPEHGPRIEKVLGEVRETGKAVLNFETVVSAPGDQGRKQWLLGSYFPVTTEDGSTIGVGGTLVDISAQKATELRLRESEERYDFALEAGKIGVWEMDVQSPEILWSKRQFEIFGLDQNTSPMTYERFLGTIHPEDRPKVSAEYEQALRGKRDFKLVYRVVHPEKGIRWIDAAGRITFDEAGRPRRMIGVNADITDAKIAEIRKVEQGRLLDLTQDAVLICDEHQHVLFWNRGAELLYGFTKEEAVGKASNELLHTTLSAPLHEIEEQLRTRGTWVGESGQVTKSGERLTVLTRWVYDKREDGTIRILKTNSDISERKKFVESLKESEARFRELANALPLIVWTATPDGFVDWYNDWWYQYLGLPKGTRWDDEEAAPMHPDDAAKTNVLWYKTVAEGKPFNMEQRFRRGSDGEYRWHLVRGVPIHGQDGRILKYVGANTDIQDQKVATQALLEERALRERFINTLTHDLRNPLAAAKMAAQIVLRYRDDTDKRDRHLPKITEAIERADRMIGDLLDANRIKAGEPLPLKLARCDLRAIIVQSLDELSVLHGDRFELHDDGPCPGTWSCEGLRRVVDNLATNAVKYGSPDTRVTVTLEKIGDKARLKVHNAGNEISPEDVPGLFDLYHRLPAAEASGVRGWGIGLTLVKGIVQAHGGRAWVESEKGSGTTFFVELPLDAGSES